MLLFAVVLRTCFGVASSDEAWISNSLLILVVNVLWLASCVFNIKEGLPNATSRLIAFYDARGMLYDLYVMC